MNGRKVIQISTSGGTDDYYGSVFALCEDGTMWWASLSDDPDNIVWEQLPVILEAKKE